MNRYNQLSRRKFLQLSAIVPVWFTAGLEFVGCDKRGSEDLIKKIESSIIWPGRTGGPTWFHPRACLIPSETNPVVLMTCQNISGSDVFGQVYWSNTQDNGYSWLTPQPINALKRIRHQNGIEEGTCDVVPEYHKKTGTVLAIGHNVYYENNVLTLPYQDRYPVYVTGDADGNWSVRRKLEWDNPETSGIYTCGCSQRITLGNGQILLPLSFGPRERQDRRVCTVLCNFDGTDLTILKSGNELALKVKRGLLEPSLARMNNRYFMTMRAEDGYGYVTVSDDGLLWDEMIPWSWDDGERLIMSSTQQHWLHHSHGLFLVYTRKTDKNINVMRWRAPLFMARVDTENLCLKRNSERIIFPMIGDGINGGDQVARMGNFHVVNASRNESWITVGETLPLAGWRGNTLLGRILWQRANDLVST